MGIYANIMRTALEDVLSSKDRWCTGALAKNSRGFNTPHSSTDAVSWCAEGALQAAAYMHVPEIRERAGWRVSMESVIKPLRKGVINILNEQHPEFKEAEIQCNSNETPEDAILPGFNDGLKFVGLDNDAEMRAITLPSVGYEGIRSAFEKYLAICEEKDL